MSSGAVATSGSPGQRVGDHLLAPPPGRRVRAGVVLDDRLERHADRRLDERDDDAGAVLAGGAVDEHRPVADVIGDDLDGAHDVVALELDHLVVQVGDVDRVVDATRFVGGDDAVDDGDVVGERRRR